MLIWTYFAVFTLLFSFGYPVEVSRDIIERILSHVNNIKEDVNKLNTEVETYLQVEEPEIASPGHNTTRTLENDEIRTPRLIFHPHNDGVDNVIRYTMGRESTIQPLYDDLLNITDAYALDRWPPNEFGFIDDCGSWYGYRHKAQWARACRFDLPMLGPSCTKYSQFGYDDGQPCVLFNLEQVYQWLPIPYDNSSVPANIRDLWQKYHITLKCEGADAASRERIGELSYYPRAGFKFAYFPYLDQRAYRSPLVFVQFDNPQPGVPIRVECKAYARNIIHDRIHETGMVSFELQID